MGAQFGYLFFGPITWAATAVWLITLDLIGWWRHKNVTHSPKSLEVDIKISREQYVHFTLIRAFRKKMTYNDIMGIYTLGMCISVTEADAIRILMHSQRYDILQIHIKQLLLQCDMIHPYYDAMRTDFDLIQHNVIQCNTKQWNKIWCYAIQYGTLLFLWFRQRANHKWSAFWLLMSWSLYCCDASYSCSSNDNSLERRNQSAYKILVTNYWSISK